MDQHADLFPNNYLYLKLDIKCIINMTLAWVQVKNNRKPENHELSTIFIGFIQKKSVFTSTKHLNFRQMPENLYPCSCRRF
jgi:hypothetical protein